MAIELMVTDCLLEADQELGLSASAENADDFMRLDDTILKVAFHAQALSQLYVCVCTPWRTLMVS